MKSFRITAILSLLAVGSFASSAEEYYEVNTAPDPHTKAFRPGEVIVNFRLDTPVSVRRNAKGAPTASGVSSVDNVLSKLGVSQIDQLMPLTGALPKNAPRRVKSYNGGEIELKDMSHLYLVKVDDAKVDVCRLAEELSALPEVEYAEPNYLVYACSTPNDPLYSEQWGIPMVKADKLWDKPQVTSNRPVVAILDTGVDIAHPDLQANIWTNTSESTGEGGYDDDSNGFIDDVCGWDFVNQTGIIQDYNGHGTHCAGIAAAVGNNGIGICGANPDALIMPITVMQSDGTGDVATIVRGIDYAAANGADILSMSFGGYAYSIAEEQALARAYSKCVLVAAAGNNGKCIYPHICPRNDVFGSPMFPAAFTFVLGVQAYNASFSNFDCDGPIYFDPQYFSEEQMYNYELTAPGTNIISTYPGGKYKSLNGTSMACPLVAGAISRLLSSKEYASKEILFGDLIHSAGSNVDFEACYNISDADRTPNVRLVSWRIEDETDHDGRFDAGETIKFYPTIRNDWGTAQNMMVWLELAENEGRVVEMSQAMADFDKPLSSYAKAESANPIIFKIKEDVVDGRHIRLNVCAQCDGMDAPMVQEIVITAENGVEIGGMIDHDMTLEEGVSYIVTNTLAVPDGVKLTINPGTVLKFGDNTGISKAENANVIIKGTADKPIIFTSRDNTSYPSVKFGFTEFEYVIMSYLGFNTQQIDRCTFYNCDINNCRYENNNWGSFMDCEFISTNVHSLYGGPLTMVWESKVKECNISGNSISNQFIPIFEWTENFRGNNILNNFDSNKNPISFSTWRHESYVSVFTFDFPNYIGSSEESIARKSVVDIESGYGVAKFDLSNMLTQPNPDAHGIVWKVVVDGYDAQDEFDMLPPLGVGRHKFEVWYSKKIDESEAPFIAMGVRPPYTQTAIAENGSWRTETTHYVVRDSEGNITDERDIQHSVYTAYVDIKGAMAIDGLNRIYVSGCEDLEHFEIPLENLRFNVEVSAAGSMSTGFFATPGIGKVDLEWEDLDMNVEDIMGYNLYRIEDKTRIENVWGENPANGNWEWYDREIAYTDTVRVNQRLIDEPQYTDFDVVPGQRYDYYYKVMRTDMAETSPSKVVSVVPLTASKGDANGSLTVDVADVVTEVAYLTGGDPQPFIFEAADVNSDEAINILDIVGTINIIISPTASGVSAMAEGTVTYWVADNVVYIDTDVALGGLQLSFDGNSATDRFTVLDAIKGFENVGVWNEDGYLFLAYSMTGRTLEPGTHAILEIEGDATIHAAVASDKQGHNVVTIAGEASGIESIAAAQMRVPTPNPFHVSLTIPYVIGKDGSHKVQMLFTDMMGRTVDSFSMVCGYGEYSYTWTPSVSNGVYMVTLVVDGEKLQTAKVIKK